MDTLGNSWLVGTGNGVYRSTDGNAWERLGAYQFWVTAFDRSRSRILASTGSGLWEVNEARWIQLHDETLTEVMDVIDAGDHIVAASAYGLTFGTALASGATEWAWRSDDLPVNLRFTSAILKAESDRILVGTEGGVLVYQDGWHSTSVVDTAVRCLARWKGRYLAGTDAGLWSSADGMDWERTALAGPVYALAGVEGLILGGTEEGIVVSEKGNEWREVGMGGTRVGAVAVDNENEDRWFAGGVPGGLWLTEDAGSSWSAFPDLQHEVKVISGPGGRS